jgi:hypothetical protein
VINERVVVGHGKTMPAETRCFRRNVTPKRR